MYPDELRPTGLVEYPRHKERRAKICLSRRVESLAAPWTCGMGRWDAEPRRLEAAEVFLIDFIDECARCTLMSHDPRAWWSIRAIRKGERAKICQDEWRAWRHRGLVVWGGRWDAGPGAASARSGRGILVCLILSMNVLDVP